jgi:hypothetical protein
MNFPSVGLIRGILLLFYYYVYFAGGSERKSSMWVGVGHPHAILCPICGKLYAHQTGLRGHMKRIHSKETPYDCNFPGCGKKFKV